MSKEFCAAYNKDWRVGKKQREEHNISLARNVRWHGKHLGFGISRSVVLKELGAKKTFKPPKSKYV